MMAGKRQRLLIGLLLALVALGTWWSFSSMMAQRRQARLMASDLDDCRRLAGEIQKLQAQPMVASARDLEVQELGRRIQEAMKAAQLAESVLESVAPQSARRIGTSPYVHKPTALSLRGATLTQLVTFLYHLTADTGLTVRDLRLSTPRGTDSPEPWDAQVTVVYLLYAPSSRSERPTANNPGS